VTKSDVRLLARVLPSKIVAFGRNYAEHARELGNAVPDTPIVFLKTSTSVVGPGEPIAYPPLSRNVVFEGDGWLHPSPASGFTRARGASQEWRSCRNARSDPAQRSNRST
jgi:hypothetical protein